jgi:hypothetical protein
MKEHPRAADATSRLCHDLTETESTDEEFEVELKLLAGDGLDAMDPAQLVLPLLRSNPNKNLSAAMRYAWVLFWCCLVLIYLLICTCLIVAISLQSCYYLIVV